ncbi:MAG: 50S ribosomal protein L20 [Fimbriimonadaceae bacterium]
MARIKRGLMRHKRHKKLLSRAKGYYGRKKNVFKNAHEQVMKSGQYAFRDRRAKKREFRRLWVVRISAACRNEGVKYGDFIHAMTIKGIEVNRKMLSELAINDPAAFSTFVKTVVS